jgi:dCTP deaminase
MRNAAALRPGQSLMPLYREFARGDEMVYQPLNGHLVPTHRLADEWNVRGGFYADAPGTHRHHIDSDQRNNRPTNIIRVPTGERIRRHNGQSYGEDFDAREHGASIADALARLAVDPAWFERFAAAQAARARAFWTDARYADVRAKVIEARRNCSEATRGRRRDAALPRYLDPQERAKQGRVSAAAWARDDGRRRRMQAEAAALDTAGSHRAAARLLDCDRSAFRRFPDIVASFRGRPPARNHKVVAVRDLPGDHDVYCLTVPEAGNFAIEAGVFVRNCGIIVNVTPFEPEWEGYVTLEFSNTTPLPAKIYANEGVAQVIFFESDEVCETSYKDRGGKYQGQQGVTLPKA